MVSFKHFILRAKISYNVFPFENTKQNYKRIKLTDLFKTLFSDSKSSYNLFLYKNT